jgi:predicted amidohydrolase YtcJ
MICRIFSAVLALSLILTCSVTLAAPVLVTSANIYSVDDSNPKPEAFVYEQQQILAIGNKAELRQSYPNASTLDFGDATIVPGIIDAHVHLLSLGQALSRVDLVGAANKAEVMQRLVEFEKTLPPGQWMLGRGWDQNDWPGQELPTAAELDQAFPERPIWLTRIDGHAAWANSAAMKFAKRDLNGSWQPDGGEIVRDDAGKATGVFIDNAEALIANHIPAPSKAEMRAALERAMQKTASVGLTSVHNAGTSKMVWDVLNEMADEGNLNVRYYAMADGSNAMLDYLCEAGPQVDPEAMLTARAVKLYSDGALGSRGAALLEPYSDRPHQRGLLIEPPEVLKKYAERAAKCGLQVNIHAIGDRGNRVTLDALEAASKFENPGRHRNEHSQVVAPEDFERFKQLDVIASVQPTHATSDMYWAEDRVGAERIKGAYAWQTFLDNGIRLALGSDFPVERADPLLGFHAAVTRQDAKNWPDDGWYPDQILSREQALKGFTLDAAYAAFQEQQLGSLSVGKKADFVVLSQDIMQVPAEQILSTDVLATYLNGEAIFTAGE